GKPVSIPSKRWKLIAAVLRTTPRGIVATLSGVLSHRRSREK
ncbi:MAG: short-chain dehydrogenase, partial [Actinomycetales bacterium]|nr:short-chain dehydrogenase [Actinomycetales bacterium]